jgi:hypothetical protein
MTSSSYSKHSDKLGILYDVQGEDNKYVALCLYLYTTYFLFIAWSYDQSIIFIIVGGVKMEGLVSSFDGTF